MSSCLIAFDKEIINGRDAQSLPEKQIFGREVHFYTELILQSIFFIEMELECVVLRSQLFLYVSLFLVNQRVAFKLLSVWINKIKHIVPPEVSEQKKNNDPQSW